MTQPVQQEIRYLTVRDIAAKTGLSQELIYRFAKPWGRRPAVITPIKPGFYIFPESELHKLIEFRKKYGKKDR